jgi:hypothetical protein
MSLSVNTSAPYTYLRFPERDQKAIIRLINSLAAIAPRRTGIEGEHNGH